MVLTSLISRGKGVWFCEVFSKLQGKVYLQACVEELGSVEN